MGSLELLFVEPGVVMKKQGVEYRPLSWFDTVLTCVMIVLFCWAIASSYVNPVTPLVQGTECASNE